MAHWRARTSHEFGSVITRHATKMERLVADLLRLARLDAHQETLSLGPCDLKSVFEDIVQDLKPLIDSSVSRWSSTSRPAPTAWSPTGPRSTTSSGISSRMP